MSIQLDTIAYTNRLRHISPGQKLLFGLGMLAFVLLAHTPAHVAVFVWMSIWIVGYANVPVRTYMSLIGAIGVFLALSLPPIMLEISHHPPAEPAIFHFVAGTWYLYVSMNGVKAAGILLLRSLSSVSCLYFILLTVPFTEMLAVLRRIGIPEILTDLLLVMYRFVFVFLETVGQLWTAQQARGGGRGFTGKMRDAGRLVTRLFTRTLQRYQQLSIGLAARGFEGELRVISQVPVSISKRYATEAIVGSVLLVTFEWWTGR
ncbi:cobalt ECF transporter T component CbiQ [Aneurinibacillus aneurinilyticus]|jgi:cobalt/nickel transport system permease protein|uniref:Cobalt ECF transporter T component CbiQ n=3 Tax=Bacillales TaxID=1385 RepID=A0A848D0S5_ANEAE|nr:cobalt ECF transporter T component CbiQ [Aneurinibacillus aneurinilyticus]ERI05179.1 cobalt ABC transporter, permease protein CbiQ [Aneurinibacillus aneurinilyticus ATCC 12856]MCI1694134.1 cobalt ECF transporter T component CbiQ [Aneurinibacillus aneurinilyticus]MED0672440.1 cobalt ECF transporter T component CbiQ [Aneurinibacillus aneurinilyticus]MED0708158.1 cobalt ECF transporter T component CbiQ [Aneurinibacillus aneurinilyticus]MED0721489.1 cobalt ECF transporter T component CbiQ [Aneu